MKKFGKVLCEHHIEMSGIGFMNRYLIRDGVTLYVTVSLAQVPYQLPRFGNLLPIWSHSPYFSRICQLIG